MSDTDGTGQQDGGQQDGGQGDGGDAGTGQQQGQQGSGQGGDGGKPDPDWKAEARKWEQRAKDNSAAAKKLAALEAANQTDAERAQAAARQAEQRAEAAVRRVASAEIRAALTGVVPDPAAVVEDLDLGRFIDSESGDVNGDAVAALKAKYAALAPPAGPRAPAPNPAQGAGGAPKSLGELIADAEKNSDGSRAGTRDVMRMKSRMLLKQQQGQ